MFYHGQESEFLHTEVLRVCVLSWAIESEVFHTEVLRVCVLSWTIESEFLRTVPGLLLHGGYSLSVFSLCITLLRLFQSSHKTNDLAV